MDDANNTHQQDVPKAYETADDAQHLLMHEQSIPRAFFINKALPEVCTIQRGDATGLSDPTSTGVEMTTKEGTKRGLQFLHMSDNVPKQSGTTDVAKRQPMPDDTQKKEKEGPNVQVTQCQEASRDETRGHTYDEEFGTIASYDKKTDAATLANYANAPETHYNGGVWLFCRLLFGPNSGCRM